MNYYINKRHKNRTTEESWKIWHLFPAHVLANFFSSSLPIFYGLFMVFSFSFTHPRSPFKKALLIPNSILFQCCLRQLTRNFSPFSTFLSFFFFFFFHFFSLIYFYHNYIYHYHHHFYFPIFMFYFYLILIRPRPFLFIPFLLLYPYIDIFSNNPWSFPIDACRRFFSTFVYTRGRNVQQSYSIYGSSSYAFTLSYFILSSLPYPSHRSRSLSSFFL